MIVIESKSEVLSVHAISARRPLVVELVGPPGAGKTTLLRLLCQRDKKILPGIRLRKTTYIPFFISKVFYWLPIFLSRYSHSRWFTWGELRALTYLSGWLQVLERRTAIDDAVVVLDHGPIFRLALLREFGPEMIKSRPYDKWWNRVFAQWAKTLSLIFWLDASDGALLKRIHNRNQTHRVKGKPEHDVYEFLARYRSAYRDIIGKLAAHHGPALLCFDTEKQSPEQIAGEMLAAIEVKRNT
ncbi:AAA family ATPase [candidate division KSB1 bacterium]|nr:AAA family ATPase [candidate division KSB1 bacterium]